MPCEKYYGTGCNVDMIKKTIISHDQDEIKFPNQPDILDVELGLKYVIGNKKLLKKLLIEFHLDHKNDATRLKELLASNDLEKADMLLHTIKGISANIGAQNLYTSISILEKKLSVNLTSYDEDFIKFLSTFDELMSQLKEM